MAKCTICNDGKEYKRLNQHIFMKHGEGVSLNPQNTTPTLVKKPELQPAFQTKPEMEMAIDEDLRVMRKMAMMRLYSDIIKGSPTPQANGNGNSLESIASIMKSNTDSFKEGVDLGVEKLDQENANTPPESGLNIGRILEQVAGNPEVLGTLMKKFGVGNG